MRDLDNLFDALKRSSFRRRFRLGEAELEYLRALGTTEVLGQANRFLVDRLGSAAPDRDGRQTPFRGHPVFVAQHATATCCRGCVEKWHHIPRGRPLTQPEVAHLVRAIGRWLAEQTTGEAIHPRQHDLWG